MVARKATGSFYTPRVVGDWMVDQALLVYLKECLVAEKTRMRRRTQKRLLEWMTTGTTFMTAVGGAP
jgi:hypothetical protein